MATTFEHVGQGFMQIAWSAVGLFFEGFFWLSLEAIVRLSRLWANFVEWFILVARGPPPSMQSTFCDPEENEYPVPPSAPMYMPREDKPWEYGFTAVPDRKPAPYQFPAMPERKPCPNPWDREGDHVSAAALDKVTVPHFNCSTSWHCRKKWYSVLRGRVPGVYECSEDAERQVKRFSNQKHKSFKSKEEAEYYFIAYMASRLRTDFREL